MDNKKTSTVAHISGLAQGRHQDERKQRKLAFTRALVHGIARLIEGQRQFADEFGLSLNRVFPNSYEALEGSTPTQLAISLFTADWESISELENLFDDLTPKKGYTNFGALNLAQLQNRNHTRVMASIDSVVN